MILPRRPGKVWGCPEDSWGGTWAPRGQRLVRWATRTAQNRAAYNFSNLGSDSILHLNTSKSPASAKIQHIPNFPEMQPLTETAVEPYFHLFRTLLRVTHDIGKTT